MEKEMNKEHLYKYKVRIFLKSGQTVEVVCNSYHFYFNDDFTEFVSYELVNVQGNKSVIVAPKNIAGAEVIKLNEGEE